VVELHDSEERVGEAAVEVGAVLDPEAIHCRDEEGERGGKARRCWWAVALLEEEEVWEVVLVRNGAGEGGGREGMG
jgi:hypothetical protein